MILVGFWGSREPARGNCISRLGMLGLRGEIDLWIPGFGRCGFMIRCKQCFMNLSFIRFLLSSFKKDYY